MRGVENLILWPGTEARSQLHNCILAATLCCLFLLVTSAQAVNTSSSEILATPDRFDGQAVTLTGTITNFRERVSQRGNPYYTFDLSDGKQAIRVFSFGNAPCRSGGATVEGAFEKGQAAGALHVLRRSHSYEGHLPDEPPVVQSAGDWLHGFSRGVPCLICGEPDSVVAYFWTGGRCGEPARGLRCDVETGT